MKNRNIIITICICILGIWLFFIPKKVTYYIGMGNPGYPIDMEIIVNNKQFYSDTLSYKPYNYMIIEKIYRNSWLSIVVSSKDKSIIDKKFLFIPFGKNIVIQYFPPYSESYPNIDSPIKEDVPFFEIENHFRHFYYE